jgi:hypothetical protein
MAELLTTIRTKVRSPNQMASAMRFTVRSYSDFIQVTFRTRIYSDLEELQIDLSTWLVYYATKRSHQDKICSNCIPMMTGKASYELLSMK